tara:strand:+ start:203 stop:388 length:186 start_codon:yes stop_codon:yes gene_type:complete
VVKRSDVGKIITKKVESIKLVKACDYDEQHRIELATRTRRTGTAGDALGNTSLRRRIEDYE